MITNQSVISEIPQLIQQFSQLIGQKVITVPFKVSYAIAKSGDMARKVEKDMHIYRETLQKEYCVIDKNKKFVITEVHSQNGQPPRQELTFINADAKKEFANKIADYLSAEIEFKGYALSKEAMLDFEKINNIPPNIIDLLMKYQIIPC